MKRLIWCALIAAGAAYGAEPQQLPPGAVPAGDGCNYCIGSFCTAMSCLPPGDYGPKNCIGPGMQAVPCLHVEGDRSWHVLVQTYGGTVSLIKDLTKHEADFISKRLLGQPATPAEEKAVRRQEADRQAQCAKQRANPTKQNFYIDCNVTSGSYVPSYHVISAEVFQ